MQRITVFSDRSGVYAQEHSTTWAGLCDWFEQLPTYPDKSSCPLVKLATFGEQRTAKGSLRHNANVTAVYGLEGDYDAGTIPPEQAQQVLQLCGVAGAIVTTPSHGLPEKGNRWRVFVPLSEPVEPERRHPLVAKLNGLLGGVLTVESFTLSQSFYVGPVQGVEYRVLRAEGVPLDQLPGLDALPEHGPPQTRTHPAEVDPLAMATKRERQPGDAREALSRIPNEGRDWHHWNYVGMATFAATGGSADGLEAWREWSERCPDDDGRESVDERWAHFFGSPPNDVGMGTLWHLAGGRPADEKPVEPEPVPTEQSGLPFEASLEAVQTLTLRGARLLRFNGCFLTYQPGEGHYREVDEELISAEVRRYWGGHLKPNKVRQAVDEIKAATVLDHYGVDLPCWIDDAPGMPPANELIACRNGVLHPQTGRLFQHSDSLLTYNALPFDYDPNAPTPDTWIGFLNSIWPNDRQAQYEFQKMVGYLLTLDTSLQKIFAIVGPKRSGKGTIARVLRALVGPRNTAAPTLTQLGKDFGLAGLVGKQLALIPDARLGQGADKAVTAERLLSISGEDAIDVARKHRTDWHGKLDARLVIMSNELPALPDASGALASRYVIFALERSFYGHEDHGLSARLEAEMPGILLWALQGLQAYLRDGYIRTPESAEALADEMDRVGSPVKAFVEDRCEWGREYLISKADLWASYKDWHMQEGIPGHPLSKELFGRMLKSAFGIEVNETRMREPDGSRVTGWKGLRLVGSGGNPVAEAFRR
jgi:P4 family phage/plasmid primase-like protien